MRTLIQLLTIFIFCAGAPGQDSNVIPFQGQLANQSGQPLSPTGPSTLAFRLYRQAVGGVAIWEESQPNVSVNAGRFTVLLGSYHALPGSSNFNSTVYLGITVDDSNPATADVEMRPRQALVPVVSANHARVSQNSEKLNGFDWSALFGVNNPNGNILGSRIAPGTVTSSQIAPQSVTAAQIAPSTITAAQIALATITSSRIASETITSNQIANGTIDVSDLAQQVAEALVRPGTIVSFGGISAPAGWFLCDGQAVSRTTYFRLSAAIGTAWGVGDGSSTFNIPDLRGVFLRGVNGFRSDEFADPGDNRTKGNAVGSFQSDAFQGHWHDLWVDRDAAGLLNGGTRVARAETSEINVVPNVRHVRSPIADGQNGVPRTAIETRPKNAYVNYIISTDL